MIALALEAITSFSVVPLRLINLMGILVFTGAMAVTGWALWIAVIENRAIPGWASIVLPVSFLGGVQLLALGVIGEYLGKLYVESKARPRYFVEQIVCRENSELFSPADSTTTDGRPYYSQSRPVKYARKRRGRLRDRHAGPHLTQLSRYARGRDIRPRAASRSGYR